MSDSHKKHIHTKAHWGQAFETESVPEMEEEVADTSASAPEAEVVKPLEVSIQEDETLPLLPVDDPAHLEELYVEGLALLKLEDSSFKGYMKQLFKKKPHYETVGKVITQAGRELAVVMNERGEKFARYDLYSKSDHSRTSTAMRSAYLPFKKVEPYLRK